MTGFLFSIICESALEGWGRYDVAGACTPEFISLKEIVAPYASIRFLFALSAGVVSVCVVLRGARRGEAAAYVE